MPATATGYHRTLILGAYTTACADARATLREWASTADVTDTDTLIQVASELVANAVTASSMWARANPSASVPYIRLVVDRCDETILVTVWDISGEPPHVPDLPSRETEHGRGLFLVEALASRWGWFQNRNMPGKNVWAEIPIKDSE